MSYHPDAPKIIDARSEVRDPGVAMIGHAAPAELPPTGSEPTPLVAAGLLMVVAGFVLLRRKKAAVAAAQRRADR